jgi:uncharacterized protein (TIGR03083 family)
MVSSALTALHSESQQLATVLNTLDSALDSAAAWTAPTRCTPWHTAALTAHITMALARLGPMLDAPEPPAALVTAAGYYRPDERFSPETDALRLDSATAAARDGGPAVAARFDTTWRSAVERCAAEPATRRVTTRHGDPMTLTDFLTTRVVEVAVHGIDLADALHRPRWTTPEAAAHITGLLLGPGHDTTLERLGLDPVAFIAKATGRDPFTPAEHTAVEARGITWLALG